MSVLTLPKLLIIILGMYIEIAINFVVCQSQFLVELPRTVSQECANCQLTTQPFYDVMDVFPTRCTLDGQTGFFTI